MNGRRIIIALDGMPAKKAFQIAQTLSGHVWGFKVNDLLFEDPHIVTKLKRYGKVFADAKLHDIPNTVANSVRRLSKAGADIITVHAAGGELMMRAAKRASGRSKIVAVTILTSEKLQSKKKVLDLARLAIRSGADGIVCSGREVGGVMRLRRAGEILRIVPGIRLPRQKKKDDQIRTVTARKAFANGATHIVIGRPITESRDPLKALKSIVRL